MKRLVWFERNNIVEVVVIDIVRERSDVILGNEGSSRSERAC